MPHRKGCNIIFTLIEQTSIVLILVAVILLMASVWSWTIIIQKTISFRLVRHQVRKFDKIFLSDISLDELYKMVKERSKGPSSLVFATGMAEWEKSKSENGGSTAGVSSRIERSVDIIIMKEQEKLSYGLAFLATVGSTAPFVGLLGTVWGIKNAFDEIAISQNTNLAIVAPGIAEALVATALGLFAAIPALIFYNKLSVDLDRIVRTLEIFADELSTEFSRELDS
ncbi:MAG: protein TolQ [Rhodobacteraceae bacterium]|jgi:biopolymer transport protein TolQ|nr:protein TolQ [Paracoccaceae bacterium]MBT6271084.1 protein TolQ [Paracoccaceae bacterium]MDG1299358.1 protein TolQ [Paracoccaceae bacterium]MDG2373872.1 protein TolQ [Paracoccaceae bacterium]|tara:strand:- start:1369 stop:2046 length:678 start_codon:yes stop_codon:yes gene_type:complete